MSPPAELLLLFVELVSEVVVVVALVGVVVVDVSVLPPFFI